MTDTNKPNYYLVPVDSSQISEIGYNAATRVLAIRFKAKSGPGSLYTYAEVPPETWATFSKSESKGKFFAAAIKGVFAHTKIVEPAPDEKPGG